MGTMLRAVVIGINEYKDERYRDKARLRYARQDATEVAHLLRSSTAFTAESITLLTDAQATRKAVQDSLNSTFSRRGFDSNTIAFFYFAGHGIVNLESKRISLCCHDVDFTDPEAGGIRLNDIYDWLAGSSAECVIAVLDACFSGGIVANRVDHLSAAEHAMHAIESLRHRDGKTIAIFAACASDEEARERKSLAHGIFTHELLRGWRDGEARESDGIVNLLGLANFLQRDMTQYKQKPQLTIRGSKPVALWKAEPPIVDSSLAAASVVTLAQQVSSTSTGKPLQQTSSARMVYHQVELPKPSQPPSSKVQDRNQLITLFLVILITALAVCGLTAFFIAHIFIH